MKRWIVCLVSPVIGKQLFPLRTKIDCLNIIKSPRREFLFKVFLHIKFLISEFVTLLKKLILWRIVKLSNEIYFHAVVKLIDKSRDEVSWENINWFVSKLKLLLMLFFVEPGNFFKLISEMDFEYLNICDGVQVRNLRISINFAVSNFYSNLSLWILSCNFSIIH